MIQEEKPGPQDDYQLNLEAEKLRAEIQLAYAQMKANQQIKFSLADLGTAGFGIVLLGLILSQVYLSFYN